MLYTTAKLSSSMRASCIAVALAWLTAPAHAAAQAAAQGPITQEQAVQIALARNQSLLAARLGIDQSKANEITAALKPNPVFGLSAQQFPVFAPSQLTFGNISDNQQFTFSLSYLFERGGKRDRRVDVARDTTQATATEVNDTERQLRFQVGQAFVGVLLAKSNLELATRALEDFTQVVDLNRQRVVSGDLAEGDYLKIALQKLQFEQDRAAAEGALVQGKAALRQFLGYDSVPEDYDVGGSLVHRRAAVTLETLDREARAARPDLLAAQANTKVANDTVGLARANGRRDVTGEVEYDRVGPANGLGFGLSVDIPIHDRNQGEIARSQVALIQARETESAALVSVLTDVANAYAALRSNEKIVSLYESGYLDRARESRDISRYAFSKGAMTLLDLLDAERTYRATELAYRQALAAHMTSIEQVNFAVGRQVIR